MSEEFHEIFYPGAAYFALGGGGPGLMISAGDGRAWFPRVADREKFEVWICDEFFDPSLLVATIRDDYMVVPYIAIRLSIREDRWEVPLKPTETY